MCTYSNHASAGINDFVKEELTGCIIYNLTPATTRAKWGGACVDGKISGAGRLMTNHSDLKMICEHYLAGSKSGLAHGFVNTTCSNGLGFAIEYVNGLQHGLGFMTEPDGEKIQIEYDNGELIRRGDENFAASSKTKGKGVFQNGQTNGQSVQTLDNGEKRVGEFKDGEIIKGIVYYPQNPINGKTQYKGEFKNGLPHGKGKFTYEFGSYYEGDFENGKFNGQGRLIEPGGDYKVGLFKNGKYVPGSGTEKDTLEARKAAQKQAEKDRALERIHNIRIIRVD